MQAKPGVDALVEKRLGEDLDSALDSLNEVRTHIHVCIDIILVVIGVRNCYYSYFHCTMFNVDDMLYLFYSSSEYLFAIINSFYITFS